MTGRPAVSVIIPAYNGEEFLSRCLDSVYAQTLKNIQVICVNDGSTDGTATILAEYQHLHPELVVVSQENGGLSVARNAGLSYATGEYVDFLDCDDWLQQDTLAKLYDHAVRDSLDMLFYDGETVYESEELKLKFPGYETLYKTKIRVGKSVLTGEELFVRLVDGKSYRASACMYLLRLDYLKERGFSFLPGVYYEDNVFTLQCLLDATRTGVDPTPYYKRSMRDSSIVTVKKNFRHARSYYICQNALQHFVFSRKLNADTVRCVQQQISSLMNHATQVYSELTAEERSTALAQYSEAQLIDSMLRMRGISTAPPRTKAIEEKAPRPAWMKSGVLNQYAKQPYQKETPFVSVVLPVYNAAEYLRETVEDLQGQRLSNFEMIFVDDGSTDDSCIILEEYAKNDPRIQIVKQKNQYAGVARNNGMARAKGEYLLFLDSDDRFDPNMLLYAYACARNNEAQIVLFHADLLQMPQGTHAEAAFLCPCRRLPVKVFSGKEGKTHIFDVLNPWTKLFSREYIRELGIRYQSLFSSNDLYFSMVAMASAERIAPLPEVLVHYRVGQTTNIQSKKSKAPLDVYQAFVAVKEELLRRELFDEFRKPFAVKAAESMLRSLDTMTTLEGYRELYSTLHDGGLAYLEIDCVSAEDMQHISSGALKLERCHAIADTEYEAYMLKALTSPGQIKVSGSGPSLAYVQEIERLQADVRALRQSYAFRIGSKITRPLHFMRKYVKQR